MYGRERKVGLLRRVQPRCCAVPLRAGAVRESPLQPPLNLLGNLKAEGF